MSDQESGAMLDGRIVKLLWCKYSVCSSLHLAQQHSMIEKHLLAHSIHNSRCKLHQCNQTTWHNMKVHSEQNWPNSIGISSMKLSPSMLPPCDAIAQPTADLQHVQVYSLEPNNDFVHQFYSFGEPSEPLASNCSTPWLVNVGMSGFECSAQIETFEWLHRPHSLKKPKEELRNLCRRLSQPRLWECFQQVLTNW